MNDIKEIDIDLIRELKRRGLTQEAYKLVIAFRADLQKNKEQLKRENFRIYQSIRTLNFRNKGLCYICGKLPKKGGKLCLSCLNVRTKHRKKLRAKEKSKISR